MTAILVSPFSISEDRRPLTFGRLLEDEGLVIATGLQLIVLQQFLVLFLLRFSMTCTIVTMRGLNYDSPGSRLALTWSFSGLVLLVSAERQAKPRTPGPELSGLTNEHLRFPICRVVYLDVNKVFEEFGLAKKIGISLYSIRNLQNR